jgi:hypothetical protein
MQIDTHESDLYVLPESNTEAAMIRTILEDFPAFRYRMVFSDAEGNSWYGKTFFEIPFGSCLASIIRKEMPEVRRTIQKRKELL